MTNARTPPTGRAGSHFFGRRQAALEPLPMAGPEGVDPDLWARIVVADRGRGWVRLTVGELVRAHPRTAIGLCATGGSTGLVLLGRLLGVG